MQQILLGTVAGSLILLAGLFTLGRLSLLEPTSSRYPKAPLWLRQCMFGFASLQIFIGLHAITDGRTMTNPMALMAMGLCLYNGAMLLNLIRQRYPEHVWDRLNRINDRLFCNHTSARKWLSHD